MPITPGTRLGQYEVQDFIGQGAMGLVYRAYHPQLARTCAVKVLHSITPDTDTAARFRHEAQAIARLRHPNILDVYDFGEFEGTPYMIVEYVPGGSLATRLERGIIDQPTALKFLRGIAAGLDYAHSSGVVHRDVKPANVLLTSDDTPVLADFGLAKLMQGSSLKSMSGVTTGTPAYMSPEQVSGTHVGPAADRYALASIAYEMVTGAIPFDGEALLELLYAQVHRQPPLPSSRNPALSGSVDAVIMRGLAKDPAARWESCSAFVDALASALDGKAVPSVVSPLPLAGAAVDSTFPLAKIIPAGVPTAASGPIVNPHAAPAAVPVLVGPGPATQARRRFRKRTLAFGAGVIAILLVFAILVNVAANPETTISLSSTSVVPGESLVVGVSNVPANQAGEIQLWSTLTTYQFQADANGDVSITINVPRDIGVGDHQVKACWGGQCHAQTTLKVLMGIPKPSPTPSASPTPTVSPSPAPRALALSSGHIRVKTGTLSVYGQRFPPRAAVTVSFSQGQNTAVVGTTTAGPDGTWLVTFTIPQWAVLGPAAIKGCDTACAYATVAVTAT